MSNPATVQTSTPPGCRLRLAAAALACAVIFSLDAHAAVTESVSPMVCAAQSSAHSAPNRNLHVSNFDKKATRVNCPLTSPGASAVAIVRIYGSAAAGTTMPCSVVNVRKQDGAVLAFKFVSITGGAAGGASSAVVVLDPAYRSIHAVPYVSCTLPAGGRGALFGFDVTTE